MMTNRNSFTKVLGPVLLLAASLSIPAVSTAAPSPDKDKGRKEQVKENRKHRQEQQRENAKHRAQQQRENAKHRAEQQRENAKHRAEQQRVAQRQVRQQPVYVAQRRANPRANRPWYGWERGRGTGSFVLDGTFVDQQYGCQLIREHSGRVIPIVGNGGGIRKGDHVRLSGRVDNSTVCGPAFRVTEVQNIWADASHRGLIFDRRRDGDFDGSFLEDDEYRRQGRYPDQYRNGRRDNRYNDRYDDNYRGNGRLISVDGRLGGNGDCPSLRASNGEVFGLEGDLSGRDYGDNVRVVGFLDGARSGCGYNRTISIHEVNGR